jgi:hypothetical protein
MAMDLASCTSATRRTRSEDEAKRYPEVQPRSYWKTFRMSGMQLGTWPVAD